MDWWNECLTWCGHVFNYIYSQAKDVKLLKWVNNNNNYDIMILHMILKGFSILCNYLLKKL
jgi:hypothetical protein